MKHVQTLGNWAQVRAVARPLRLQMLEAFGRKAMTTKQVASALGEKPTRLYHHVEILEQAGLIRLISTKRKRGTVEKYYRATASEFMIDRRLLERGGTSRATGEYERLFLSALEATLAEARSTIAAGLITPIQQGRNALMFRQRVKGSPQAIDRLMREIKRSCEKFQMLGRQSKGPSYGLTIAFYPVKSMQKDRG